MILVAAMLAAPLIGVDPAKPTTAHRVDLDGLPVANWAPASSARAVYGIEVRLVARDALGEIPSAWRNLRTRGTAVTRCAECRAYRRPTEPQS